MEISCLDENQAIHFIKGRLPADLAQQIDLHILSCPRCVDLILDVTAKLEQEDGPSGSIEASTQEVPPPLAGGQSIPPPGRPIKLGFSQELAASGPPEPAAPRAAMAIQKPASQGTTTNPPARPEAEGQSSGALLGILFHRHRLAFTLGGLALCALIAALIIALLR